MHGLELVYLQIPFPPYLMVHLSFSWLLVGVILYFPSFSSFWQRLAAKAFQGKKITDFRLAKGVCPLTHIQFVDDSTLLHEATFLEAQKLQKHL